MIGVAVLSCEEASFHAKASKKITGSKECIQLIKKANRTSSICNDVVGDICGIITGSITASLVLLLYNTPFVAILLIAFVSALTVGGKAIGKKVVIEHSENITFFVGKMLSKITVPKKR